MEHTSPRDNLLAQAWMGEPLVLEGRELILSYGRHELLRTFGNSIIGEKQPDQSPLHAMAEIAMVCWMQRDELLKLRSLTRGERHSMVLDFCLAHEGHMARLSEGIEQRLAAISAAMVESEAAGKREPVQTQSPNSTYFPDPSELTRSNLSGNEPWLRQSSSSTPKESATETPIIGPTTSHHPNPC